MKKLFQTIPTIISTIIVLPFFHHLNINDNVIIMVSCASRILTSLIRALAKTETVFYVSTLTAAFQYFFYAPTRQELLASWDLESIFCQLTNHRKNFLVQLRITELKFPVACPLPTWERWKRKKTNISFFVFIFVTQEGNRKIELFTQIFLESS